MSNFTQSGTNFTIQSNFGTGEMKHPVKGKITSGLNDYQGYEQDDASMLINAVDIDWNAAELPNGDIETGSTKTINTTGELLAMINKMQEQIYVLSAAVVALSAKVGS